MWRSDKQTLHVKYCIRLDRKATPSLGNPADRPHVDVVVGLEPNSDLWGYAVEPLMADRPKVRFQTIKDTGIYAVRWSRFASGTHLFIRRDCASVPVAALFRKRNPLI